MTHLQSRASFLSVFLVLFSVTTVLARPPQNHATGSAHKVGGEPQSLGVVGIPDKHGIRITDIIPGGPAQAAGLTVGDVLNTIDGRPIKQITEIRKLAEESGEGKPIVQAFELMTSKRVGSRLAVTYMRGGHPAKTTLILREPGLEALASAIASGKVRAEFHSIATIVDGKPTGASSGDAITVTVTKTATARTLVLTVPPGTRLNNSSGTGQSMVIAAVRGREVNPGTFLPESTITVSTKPVTYTLEAYCAEFHKDNPSPSSTFELENPDEALSCILRQASKQGLSLSASQAAVWIQTDRVSFDNVNQKFGVTPQDWNAAVNVVRSCQ